MEKDTDFDKRLRKLPYKAPEGFFEQVSEKTLVLAKKRAHKDRKIRIALGIFAVAASLSVVAFLGYFRTVSVRTGTMPINMEQAELKHLIPQAVETVKPEVRSQIYLVVPDKGHLKENQPEDLKDVLPELTDDELLQLAAVDKADLFIDGVQY